MVRPETAAPAVNKSRIVLVKVIASSLRKGNIVDIDSKLYVVLTAENFHPGKGTPTTQVDMRPDFRWREDLAALQDHRSSRTRSR